MDAKVREEIDELRGELTALSVVVKTLIASHSNPEHFRAVFACALQAATLPVAQGGNTAFCEGWTSSILGMQRLAGISILVGVPQSVEVKHRSPDGTDNGR